MPDFREPTVLNPGGYQEVLSSTHTLSVPGSITVATDPGSNPEVKFFNGPGLTANQQVNLSVTDALLAALKILTDSGLAQFSYDPNFVAQMNLLGAQLQNPLPAGTVPVGNGTGAASPSSTTYDNTKRQELSWTNTGASFQTALSFSSTVPTPTQIGELWVDTTYGVSNPALKVWNGTAWNLLSNVGGNVDLGRTVNQGDLYVGDPGNLNPGITQSNATSDLGRLGVGSANQQLTVDENGDYPEWRTWFYHTSNNSPPAGAKDGAIWLDTLSNQVGIYDENQALWYRSYFNNANLNDIAEEAFVSGDLIKRGTTRLERLPRGSEHTVLRMISGQPTWQPLIETSNTPPLNPAASDLWFNPSTGQLSIAEQNGASIAWQLIGSHTVRLFKNPAEALAAGNAVKFVPGGLVKSDTAAEVTRDLTGIALREDPVDDTFWYVAVEYTVNLTEAEWQSATTEAEVTGLTPGADYWLTDIPGKISKFRPSTVANNGNYDSYVGIALSPTQLLVKHDSNQQRYTTSLHYMNDVADTNLATGITGKGILVRDAAVVADASPDAYKLVSLVDLGSY